MENRAQATFNDAVGYLGRIKVLFYLCDEAAIGLEIYTWFHGLMAIFRELSTEMTPEEIEEFSKNINAINPMVAKAYNDYAITGMWKVDPVLYHMLHTFELELRKVYKSSGLQMRMEEDAGTALI